jgi:signal transduction histidine kinase
MAKLLQLFVLLCCLGMNSLCAQNKELLVLNKGFEMLFLDEVVEAYRDSAHVLTIQQIKNGQIDAQPWDVRSPGHMINMGYSRDTWWLHWELLNNSPQPQFLTVFIGSGILSDATLYAMHDSSGITIIDSFPSIGFDHPYQPQHFNPKGWSYDIKLLPGKHTQYWLKLHNEIASLRSNLQIWERASYQNQANIHNLGWGVFFGILILTVLGALAVFLATRQLVFLYYALYIASILLLNSITLGLHLIFLGMDNAFGAHTYVFVVSSLVIICMFAFSKKFLNLSSWAPRLNYVIYFNYAVVVILTILWFIWPSDMDVFRPLIFVFTFLPLISLVVINAKLLTQKSIPSQHKLYLIAFSPIVLLSIGIALRNIGLIGHSIIFDIRLPVSFAFESIVFSYALAIRIRDMRNEREMLLQQVNVQQRDSFRVIIEATEKERKRVAEDLHDGLGQLLSTAKLNLTAIETDDIEENKNLNTSIAIIDEACQEIRHISHNMMPGTLIRLGLVSAVKEQARKINASGKILVTVSVSGFETRMDESREIALYRVIQELLNNAIRYANATDVEIKLEQLADGYLFSIKDNGKGFDPKVLELGKGIGWRNIRSRVDLLQGNIDLKTAPGKGTVLNIWIP